MGTKHLVTSVSLYFAYASRLYEKCYVCLSGLYLCGEFFIAQCINKTLLASVNEAEQVSRCPPAALKRCQATNQKKEHNHNQKSRRPCVSESHRNSDKIKNRKFPGKTPCAVLNRISPGRAFVPASGEPGILAQR